VKQSKRVMAVIAAIGFGLSGCVTSHVIVGKVRPPIAPEDVQLYLHPPGSKYEEVALLESSSKHSFSFTAQGKTNAVIERMKTDAAKLGANGILLDGVSDQAGGSVGSGFGSATIEGNTAVGVGFGTSKTIFIKSGRGLAIYVSPATQSTNRLRCVPAVIMLSTPPPRTEQEIVQEYRTRLKADLATGKLDVRLAAAKMPATRE
jgi:hypothetical protein